LGTKKLKEQLDLNNNGEHINERFFKVWIKKENGLLWTPSNRELIMDKVMEDIYEQMPWLSSKINRC
jgi:hypothetical protein